MFAVIKTGGKQYVVKEGDRLNVETLDRPAGQKVLFDQILLVDDGTNTALGAPFLGNAAVRAEVVRHFKDDKILVFKKKRRKQYRRTHGHRQNLTEVRIEKIFPDKSAVPADELTITVATPAPAVRPTPIPPAPKTAAKPKAARTAKPAEGARVKPTAKAAKAAPKTRPAKSAAKPAPAEKPKARAKKTAK